MIPAPHRTLIGQDLKYALRAIRRNGWLSLAVVVTLAVGVGMNAIVFSAFNGLLFRPNVTRDPDSFVQMYADVSGSWTRDVDGSPTLVTLDEYELIRDSTRTLAAVTVSRWASFAVRDREGEAAVGVRGQFVSCDYLAVHLNPMRRGRGLIADDCAAPGGAPVVVLTERAWTLHFGRDPNIIGRVIRVNDQPLTVVGVAPDDAVGGPVATMVYVPYTLQPVLRGSPDVFRARGRSAWLSLSGRLPPGQRLEQVQAELDVIAQRIDRLHPGQVTRLLATDGALIHEPDSARTMPALIALCLGTTLLLLMLVCGNVGTLLLARGVGRRHETAVRLSLGAGRVQILRQLLLETVLLGGAAALLGLACARVLPHRFMQTLTDFPLSEAFGPDWRVFGVTLGLALLAGCAAGVAPALEALRASPSTVLKASGPGAGAAVSAPMRTLLIGNQLSVSLALLIAIGLFVRAQERLLTVTLDYDTDRMLLTSIDLSQASYNGAAARTFYDRLLPTLTALPGVRRVALVSPPPFSGVVRKAVRRAPGSATVPVPVRAVSPDYFSMAGVRLLAGRGFTDQETRTRRDVMPLIVSESFARKMFPDVDSVGRRVSLGNDATAEIIGIVSDTTSLTPTARDEALIYQPLPEANPSQVAPLVQITGESRIASQAVRTAIHAIDPRLPTRSETIATIIGREASQYTTVLKILAVPAGIAVFLSIVGIYGITAFTATQRTRELGVRITFGAHTTDIVMLLVGSLWKPFVFGIGSGSLLAAVSILLLRWTRVGGEVSPTDPLPYLIAILLLTATATTATVIPALRAARRPLWTALRTP